MIYPPGATSQSIDVLIVDDVGIPVTGLIASTFPAVLYSIAGANADVALGSLSDLSTITTAWTAKGVKERAGGRYRLDLPDAVFTAAGKVTLWAEASGKRLLLDPIEVMDVATQDTAAGILTIVTATAGLATGIKGRTDLIPDAPAAVGSAMTLTSGERDAVAAALLDLTSGVESGKTLRQALRLMAAALCGKRSNAGTSSEQNDAIGGPGTARVVGNLDSSGNGTPTLTP